MKKTDYDQICSAEVLVVRRILEDQQGSLFDAAEALAMKPVAMKRHFARNKIWFRHEPVAGTRKHVTMVMTRPGAEYEITSLLEADRAASMLIAVGAAKKERRRQHRLEKAERGNLVPLAGYECENERL